MNEEMNATINDCYVDIYGVKPTESVIKRTYELLPDDIKLLATQWGWNDTEVYEKVYRWMEQKALIF